MKLLIDDADPKNIEEMLDLYPCDGVTTNPSILARSGQPPMTRLRDIRALIGETLELHAQVLSDSAEEMAREGHRIVKMLGGNTFVKIPAIPEGFKAMKLLTKEGYRVTATAIYAPMQAFLAAKSGARYAAPYVNRIENLGYDGVETARRIHDIFENNGLKTEVLAASFKNAGQVLALCEYGVGACTVSPDVMRLFVSDENVNAAITRFQEDFRALCGDGVTMQNCN